MLAPASAQEPALDAVLARAGAYVVEFQRQLSGVVAEEQYVQDVRYPLGTGNALQPAARATHRELKSDLLLVKPVGGDRWMQFRDVFEVDGKAIRDRNERLMQLFVSPSSSSAAQAERIIAGELALQHRQPAADGQRAGAGAADPRSRTISARFSFKRTDHARSAARTAARAKPPDLWVIEYQEVEKQTMIRTTNGRDLPARGRFWIEPATGRVFASELDRRGPDRSRARSTSSTRSSRRSACSCRS